MFCFQSFTLCAKLIVLQSSFIRIKKTIAKIFGLMKKEDQGVRIPWQDTVFIESKKNNQKKEANCIELESGVANICFFKSIWPIEGLGKRIKSLRR